MGLLVCLCVVPEILLITKCVFVMLSFAAWYGLSEPQFLSGLAVEAAYCSRGLSKQRVHSSLLEGGTSVQSISMETFPPALFRPHCRCVDILQICFRGRRGAGTFLLIDRFSLKWAVFLLLTVSWICRASSALVLDVPHRTRKTEGVG